MEVTDFRNYCSEVTASLKTSDIYGAASYGKSSYLRSLFNSLHSIDDDNLSR